MAFKTINTAGAERINFGKIRDSLELPNLIEVQTKPYQEFIDKHIQEIFDRFFPIVRSDGEAALAMNDWWIKEPTITPAQARIESKTYSFGIYAQMTLTINNSNGQIELTEVADEGLLIKNFMETNLGTKVELVVKKNDMYHFRTVNKRKSDVSVEVHVQKRLDNLLLVSYTITHVGTIFFGNFPKMTKKGTFIVNGSEKVVVLQLVRSPGAYFKTELDYKTGADIFYLDIIPNRGTWIEFKSEVNKKAINNFEESRHFYVKIDKSRKVSLTNFLTALGMPPEHVNDLFDHHPYISNTYKQDNLVGNFSVDRKYAINEIYHKIRSGEISTIEGAANFLYSLLFNNARYDLLEAGRYKINQKLNLLARAEGLTLAEDIKDEHGKVLLAKNAILQKGNLTKLKELLQAGVCDVEIQCHSSIQGPRTVEKIKVFSDQLTHSDEASAKVITLIGVKPDTTEKHITVADIVASISYLFNLTDEIGTTDDIDNLGNRRVRTIAELMQNQMRIGLLRIEKNVKEKMVTSQAFKVGITNILSNRPLTAVISEFFNLSQLCQFLDQTNPLSELANKRRLTALGPGGLSRDRAGLEVRDVHTSHYGKLGPIQTPEGPNIGLITNLATYARINKYGFIETPYYKVKKGHVTKEVEYLSADIEAKFIIAQANTALDANKQITDKIVVARHQNGNILVSKDKVDYIDVSPKQIVSISTSCIPFLEKDDTSRALMGANMQGQGTPLIKASSPIVGTGTESTIASDAGLAIVAKKPGKVKYADAQRIVVESKGELEEYHLYNFNRSNQKTALTHNLLIKTGDRVKANQILADGPSMEKGELALGQNALVAFTTWRGYNFEDAIIISERLQIDDVYTSLHISEYKIELRRTKQGPEEITAEVPNIANNVRMKLDENGFAMVGAEVRAGDILVGKVTPLGQVNLSPEDKLIQAIFGEKSKGVKDNSLRVPNGGDGIVQSIRRLTQKDCDLPKDVLEIIQVYVVQKRKLQEGDKMAGRHGNKGVVSIVLPVEDMPFTEDGEVIDILLNPLGVPSRMNIGQVLEMHLGLAAKKLDMKVSVPVFESISENELEGLMNDAKITNYGKQTLYDGRSGEAFDKPVAIGIMYMLKLSHMVDDKLHARNIGPYSLITQQPLGGKAQNGGQKLGEMEGWGLEAHGAAYTFREMLTLKSDDIKGRRSAYQAQIWGRQVPEPGIPESFNVLMREIKGLGFNMRLIDAETGENVSNETEEENVTRELVDFDDLSATQDFTNSTESVADALESVLHSPEMSTPEVQADDNAVAAEEGWSNDNDE